MSGVAVIIIAHQLPEFFGLPPTGGTNQHRVGYVLTHLNEVNGWSLAIGIGVLAIMLVSARLDRRIPAALIGLVASTALVAALGLAVPRRRRARHGQDRGAPPRPDRPVVVDASGAWRRSPPWWRWWS